VNKTKRVPDFVYPRRAVRVLYILHQPVRGVRFCGSGGSSHLLFVAKNVGVEAHIAVKKVHVPLKKNLLLQRTIEVLDEILHSKGKAVMSSIPCS
jgi:hypothetical protein